MKRDEILLRCALADLEGILPEYEPSGDRTHSGWETCDHIRKWLNEPCEVPIATSLSVPSIHMNGTSKEALLEAIEESYSAISGAMDKMRQCVPDGRDYYVQASEAYGVARDQHRDRCLKLQAVMDELQAIAEAIHDGKTTTDLPT